MRRRARRYQTAVIVAFARGRVRLELERDGVFGPPRAWDRPRHSADRFRPAPQRPGGDRYGEIAPASRAFCEYVNAHGGVYERRIHYTYLDDADDPTKALDDEKQLVTSDHVFAVFNAFGVITHQAVVGFLNTAHLPDLFVGSSCACWNQPRRHPETFGFGTNYTLEVRLMGHYVARAFRVAKVAYIWEDDQCCQQAVRELDQEIPRSRVVTRQTFTTPDLLKPDGLLAQVEAAKADGARVVVLDTLAPAATALVLLDAASIRYHPTIVDTFHLSADPTAVAAWIARYSAGKGSPALENGLITQDYLPSATHTANPWIRAFRRIHETYETRHSLRHHDRLRHSRRLHIHPGSSSGESQPTPALDHRRHRPWRRRL